MHLRAGTRPPHRDRDRSLRAVAGGRATVPPTGPGTETRKMASKTHRAAHAESASHDGRRAGTGPTREKQPDPRAVGEGRGHPPSGREDPDAWGNWEPEQKANLQRTLAKLGVAIASPPSETDLQRRDRFAEIARLRAFEAAN